MMSARILCTALAAATFVLVAAPVAQAAPAQTVIQGEVLQLVSIQDRAAMSAMAPQVAVAWDIGVSASRADGTIDVRLEVDATDGAFAATVRSCAVAWSADACPTGASTLSDATLVDGILSLGSQPAAESRWYRIDMRLVADVGDRRADLVFRASGMGEDVASGGDLELPPTGTPIPGLGFALAGASLVAGVLLAVVASRRRRERMPS